MLIADFLGALRLPAKSSVVHLPDRAAKAAVKTWQNPNLKAPLFQQHGNGGSLCKPCFAKENGQKDNANENG